MGIQGRAASRHQIIGGRTQAADSGHLLIQGASDGFETSLMSSGGSITGCTGSGSSSNGELLTTYSTESEAEARLRQHQQAFRASHPVEQCPHRRYLSSDGEISIPSNSSRPVSDRVHEPPFVKQAPQIGGSGAASGQFDSFEANELNSNDRQPLHQQYHHQHHQHEHHNHNHSHKQHQHEQLQRLQHQLQHRQLQAHVHQQLQRIYGDRSKRAHQEREQQQQHPVSAAAAASASSQPLSRHGKQNQQQLEQRIQPGDDSHSRNDFSSHEKLYTNKLAATVANARQQQQQPFKVAYSSNNRQQQQQQHHNDATNRQRGARAEQIYDLLSPPGRAANKQQQQQQLQSSRRQITPKSSGRHQLRGARAAGAPIGAIPEESDSELGRNIILDDVDDDDDLDDDHGDDDDDDDEHFLVPGELVSAPAGARKSVVVRKSQLANLHYATVTAAALLSATANAAAAIAATDKQFNRAGGGIQQQQQQQPVASSAGQKSNRVTKSALISTRESAVNREYSNPEYQELTKRHCCQHELDQQKMRCVHQQQQQQQQQQINHQVKLRPPGPSIVYTGGPANSNANMNPLHYQAVPAAYGGHYHAQMLRAGHNPHNRLHNPRNSQQQHQQQQLMQHAKQMHHHYHQALLSGPIPPQPPARRPINLVMNPGGGVAARQDARFAPISKQARLMVPPQMMPQANGAPASMGPPAALAVIHTGGGKNATAKADLISRMLINNMVAAQSMAAEMNYGKLSQLRSSLEQMHGQFQPIRELVRPRDKGIHSAAAIGQPAVFGLPAGRAPSDSSGNSSVPLVVNRDIAPVSFIERVCRIDLTLFWWSLLIISLLFVGIIITISRYVF